MRLGCGAYSVGAAARELYNPPAASDNADSRGGSMKVKRGRPPGPRMPCGGSVPTAPGARCART